jgi:hypothetical protein
MGVIRVGAHAQAVLPECRPKPPPSEAGRGPGAGLAASEARFLMLRPTSTPDCGAHQHHQQQREREDGKVEEGKQPGPAAASALQPSETQLGRELAKGRTGLQASYAWWRLAAGAMRTAQQRQDLLRGALAQLDEEIGPELVQVGAGVGGWAGGWVNGVRQGFFLKGCCAT